MAQQNNDVYLEAISTYIKHYNAKDYEAIFNMCASKMQVAVPLASLQKQLEGIQSQIGAINDVSLLETKKLGKTYKITHEKAVLKYSIALDDDNKIIGLRPQSYEDDTVNVIERNTTKMQLPFKGEWNVFWGGTNVVQNYHVAYDNQKYAYDILIIKDGKSYSGDPKNNENYYVFGKEIIAPCNGKVVEVITGLDDNIPGELNPSKPTGNTVIMETQNNEYILFAHLKKNSVAVTKGQEVKQGELLGLCGNSGNTTEAHLHLSLQNVSTVYGATGGKLFFDKILVNGEIKEDYLPIQGDKIQNIKD